MPEANCEPASRWRRACPEPEGVPVAGVGEGWNDAMTTERAQNAPRTAPVGRKPPRGCSGSSGSHRGS